MTENLIELVRKHPCLYNKKDNSYKNMTIKTKLWEQIGKQINVTGKVAKKKWKSLRDIYIRYKKEDAGTTTGPAAKKNKRWPWASQLQFLDATLTDRERRTNVRQSTPETSSSDAYSAKTPSPEIRLPEPTHPETLSPETPPPETTSPETPPAHSEIRSRARKNKKTDIETDKVIHFLQKNKKQEYDAIDHLFKSYAQTFKGFSKENQIKAKVELAMLFAKIETEEMQEGVQILNNSPHYSFISTEDVSYEVTNSAAEGLSPVAVIDLSTHIGSTTSNQKQPELLPQSQRNEIDMPHVTNFGASTSTYIHNDKK